MGWMIQSSRRGLIAALLAGSILVVVIGLAVAAASGGGDDDVGATVTPTQASSATPPATSTPQATFTATPPAPRPTLTATPLQDGGVSSTPVGPYVPPTDTPVPTPAAGIVTLPAMDKTPLPPGTHRVHAPIDGLDILILESFPPQYLLHIDAGLPSGCARQAGYVATRSGNTITVEVWNSMPDGTPVCTMIYGMYDLSINLGGDYVSGQTYLVNVNNTSMSFTAQ